MKLFGLLIVAVFASEKKENDAANESKHGEGIGNKEKNLILVKIEEDTYGKKKSKFIGVTYNKNNSKWIVQRWSKNKSRPDHNGHYEEEETAAHASDTLARQLMENGEQGHRLNFPEDDNEVYPEIKFSSRFIGVNYDKSKSKWGVRRWSKKENKVVCNGNYGDEETAAHASDTLARKFRENGEYGHKLNFPDDFTEIYPAEVTNAQRN